MGRGKARRTIELIEACSEILAEIQPATVRAVCYRLFTAGLIGSMAKTETNRVSRQLTDARERGVIPWEWVVDETRHPEGVSTWADPEAFARTVTVAYRRNKWAAQPCLVAVWSEKGTVRGTLAPVLDAYEVPFRVMHGYASATSVHDVVVAAMQSPRPLKVLYVGDWDPSGLHMSEKDLPERLHAYRAAEYERRGIAWWRGNPPGITIARVALAEEDVHNAALPSFPAATKRGDPRWRWYVEEHAERCWELDALSPVLLRERMDAAILNEIDWPTWTRYVEAERVELESITSTVRAWRGIVMPALK